jgi:hypothetical protein
MVIHKKKCPAGGGAPYQNNQLNTHVFDLAPSFGHFLLFLLRRNHFFRWG